MKIEFFKFKMDKPLFVIGFTLSTRKISLYCGRWIFGILRPT